MGNFHNNELPNNHFRKDWQTRVKTWFNQPGRAKRRHRNRVAKAASLGARPLKPLRPVVHCQTIRYNFKVREGYGFTLRELKEAGLRKREARGLGVMVDYRRRNVSVEGLKVNVDRLNEYKSRLIVFRRNTKCGKLLKKSNKMDTQKQDDRFEITTTPTNKYVPGKHARHPIPLPERETEEPRQITHDEKKYEAYKTLKEAWQWDKDTGKRNLEAAKTAE